MNSASPNQLYNKCSRKLLRQERDKQLKTPLYMWCCCSVTMLCPALCNSMNFSTPGFPVLHHHLDFAQIHIHWVDDAIQPSYPLLPPSPHALKSSLASGSFPMSRLLASGGQSIGAWASVSVLPVNTQGWFPLRLTGLISLQSKGLSRVFSSMTVQKHQFFGAQPLWSNSHICTWLLDKL